MLAKIFIQSKIGFQKKAIQSFLKANYEFYLSTNKSIIYGVINSHSHRSSELIIKYIDFFTQISVIIGYIVIFLILSPILVFLVSSFVSVAAISLKIIKKYSTNLGIELTKLTTSFSHKIHEAFQGIQIIKMKGMENHEIQSLVEDVKNIARINYKADLRSQIIQSIFQIIILFFIVLFILYYMSSDSLHLVDLTLLGICFLRLNPLFSQITNLYFQITYGLDSIRYFKEQMERVDLYKDFKSGNIIFHNLKKGIEFKNINFSYSTEKENTLNNINISIPAGKMTAIIGPSGSGKSTLVNLIPRLMIQKSGSIIFDEKEVDDYDLSSVREKIAYVTQEQFLFDDSIQNNLLYGIKKEVLESHIEKALKDSYCDEFIKKNMLSIHDPLGERGIHISGGQKQRISLARALISEPAILILDEPTSSLDSISEQMIQKALEKLQKNRNLTIIIIAHRLSTIKEADKIILLKEGHVIADGSHEELIQKNTSYRAFFDAQVHV
jgi:ABC-type multidrug transport system fused ATPase/permease subunit